MLFETIIVALNVDDPGVVQEPVEDGRGDDGIARWSRSAWCASTWRGLGAGCRLAVGSTGPVLCDVWTAQLPSKNIRLIATTSGIVQ